MSQRGSVNFLDLVSNAAIACGGYYVGFYIRFRGQIQPVNLKAFTASIPYIAALAMFLSWFFQLNLSSLSKWTNHSDLDTQIGRYWFPFCYDAFHLVTSFPGQ